MEEQQTTPEVTQEAKTSEQAANANPAEQPQKKPGWWSSKKRGAKIFFILQMVLLVLAVFLFFLYVYCRQIFGDEIGDEVLGQGVLNGWYKIGNGLANSVSSWVVTFITLGAASLLSFFVNWIIRLTTASSRRAKTIGSLVKSLAHYAIILIAIGVILTAWGVNVASIIAGVGVLTLVIGLGCQSLIQDVVGGLFIVFDDYFAVGDIVIIDGFRGTVTEVGLKTTKLQDGGGNIKSITNSSISTVVNLSRMDSIAKTSMDASYNEDVNRVEAIIYANLPKIKDKIPNITEGPFYKGISEFGDGGVTYFFIAKCKEADRFQVERDLNREVYLMFVENNILVPYNQITINPADPSDLPKATESQLKLVAKNLNEARGINKAKEPKKKKSFMQKVNESFDQAEKDSR